MNKELKIMMQFITASSMAIVVMIALCCFTVENNLKKQIKKDKIEHINVHFESYIEALYDAGASPCKIQSVIDFQSYTISMYNY